MSFIEPGGYLQWQEINLGALQIATAKAGLDDSNMKELLRELPTSFSFGK